MADNKIDVSKSSEITIGVVKESKIDNLPWARLADRNELKLSCRSDHAIWLRDPGIFKNLVIN